VGAVEAALMATKCNDCNAEIIWVHTMSGKRMPVDARSERRFVVMNNNDLGEPAVAIRETYISHFCPQADAFRKKGDAK
jgi:hypothetical protein